VTPTAVYLYAITRPIAPADLPELRGVAGAPVRVIGHDDLACLVSTVELSEFGEAELAAHLEDLDWLARTAREHDAVVRAVARITTTVPLRMATICSDEAAVQARLRSAGESLAAVLPELDGRDEWGVKMYAQPPSTDQDDEPGTASSGTTYLLQRRRRLEHSTDVMKRSLRDADAAYARLAEAAVASRRHRPQDQRLTGASQPMVLNGAFLVPRSEEDRFRAVFAELAGRHPHGAMVLTGPWPPYSFVPGEPS
jgi:hypothetical protein